MMIMIISGRSVALQMLTGGNIPLHIPVLQIFGLVTFHPDAIMICTFIQVMELILDVQLNLLVLRKWCAAE